MSTDTYLIDTYLIERIDERIDDLIRYIEVLIDWLIIEPEPGSQNHTIQFKTLN